MEDAGVSMPTSSLTLNEVLRPKSGGGGVRMRFSRLLQKSVPEFRKEDLAKLDESRRGCTVVSPAIMSLRSSRPSVPVLVAGISEGDDTVVAGCEATATISLALSLSRT